MMHVGVYVAEPDVDDPEEKSTTRKRTGKKTRKKTTRRARRRRKGSSRCLALGKVNHHRDSSGDSRGTTLVAKSVGFPGVQASELPKGEGAKIEVGVTTTVTEQLDTARATRGPESSRAVPGLPNTPEAMAIWKRIDFTLLGIIDDPA
jgi:hypothetical protein